MSVLKKIIESKYNEIAKKKAIVSSDSIIEEASKLHKSSGFFVSTLKRASFPSIIAEIKRASPSKGVFAADLDIVACARSYTEAGAACLSVLTDEEFFSGRLEFISAIKSQVPKVVPILRKDFIVDIYQVWETVVSGADALLLIVAALKDEEMLLLAKESLRFGLDILVEVHDEDELSRVQLLIAALRDDQEDLLDRLAVGINNRNLHNFSTDIAVTKRLMEYAKKKLFIENSPISFSELCFVSESGLGKPSDLQELRQSGVKNFLIGESLIRTGNPAMALAKLIDESSK